MAALRCVPVLLLVLLGTARAPAAPPDSPLERPRFTVDVPPVVLTGVPVEQVTVTALTLEGEVDRDFNRRVLIRGIKVLEQGREVALPPFENGILELETSLAEGRKVYITRSQIHIAPDTPRATEISVARTQRWLSIVPPLLAIVLAVWLRNVLIALFAGIWSGAVILARGDFFAGLVQTLHTFVIEELVQPGQEDHSHMMIILFTLFLGAMVGVMAGSGGTEAMVARLARFTKRREHGQLMTWALGLVIFFDDYANTLFVGSAMRPVTDRLKISREKLAFLVDSTAAPIAGLAMISTWVGVEMGYIADTYSRLEIPGEAYSVFLATIPYRFYPLHLLVFVLLVGFLGRDYGPMLKAERRAFHEGAVKNPETTVAESLDRPASEIRPRRLLLRNALVPLLMLLALIVAGLWWSGTAGIAAANREAARIDGAAVPTNVWTILDHADPTRVLFLASFVASAVAIGTAVPSGAVTLKESLDAWVEGAKGMFFACMVLVLAWGLATVCDPDHLNTAGFLVELMTGRIHVNWMPALAFLLAGLVSFATGSSWSTMGLLMPLFISVTYYLLVPHNEVDPRHPIMLGTIGAILAGSIFGDHCSPISDTTVLSSAATGCDHIDHVWTQFPYAISVGLVALVLGYVPAGFGYSPLVLLPMGVIAVFLLVQFLGRSPERRTPDAEEAESGSAESESA